MTKIKLGLADLSPEQLRDKANYVVGQMTGNPNFAVPVPTLATITGAATNLNQAIEACESGLHSAFTVRAERYDVLMALAFARLWRVKLFTRARGMRARDNPPAQPSVITGDIAPGAMMILRRLAALRTGIPRWRGSEGVE